jgi:hypothetical protein
MKGGRPLIKARDIVQAQQVKRKFLGFVLEANKI